MRGEQHRTKSVDVAREAGVSQATVSYVLNNDPRQRIPEATRVRVMEAARKLGYQPYAPARSLRSGKSKIVLVVWPMVVVEAAISQMIEELAAAVAKVGFSLVWQVGFSSEQEHLSANLAPAVVVGMVDENDAAAVASLQRFHAPIITLGNRDWINAGTRAQVAYLLKLGPRPIVYAATEKPQLQHLSRTRQEAVQQMCREHGLPEPCIVTISQTREKACQALADLLAVQSPPFAVCAYNDDVAFATLAALSDLNIAVPEAVSVIGHDNTMIAELSIPPLTTIGLENPNLTEHLIASVVSVCQGGPVLETGTLQAKVVVRASA
ncbi:LacI family transcriptional regulator [Ktedonobacter sp. SOSP1-52]|uniref:LacI family DNA-binding transcriptional regulator n=1 Tax=Ktedonobacter sp. SOSP1-52 TaxID=2778366 RepID=UPI001914DADE|nr:LacI family DNA-binding transcriptional regulator [Ktedonobacter sp. SOSP1-52]GHO65377.1 LacI family transcriptional regulator [Ktedonobacter sp. SOSP1-52]